MKARLIATGERAPAGSRRASPSTRSGCRTGCRSSWSKSSRLRGKGRDPRRATEDEGRRVIAALPKNAYVVALDVPGRQLSSEQLAQRPEHWRGQGRDRRS